jgi:hypothetical protein
MDIAEDLLASTRHPSIALAIRPASVGTLQFSLRS